MQGSSRAAYAAAAKALELTLATGGPAKQVGSELLAVGAQVDANATLRRALADPSRDAAPKKELVSRLLTGKVSESTIGVLGALVSGRWASEADLGDALEGLGVNAVLASAESEGTLGQVEDELFRFERIVAANPSLRDALTNRLAPASGKVELVRRLLGGKVTPQTAQLAEQAVAAPRGRRFDRTIEEFLSIAAKRRDQVTAIVTSASALSQQQHDRLAAALAEIYGKAVQLQTVVDPAVLGGITVRVGDEVIDGTIARKLDVARRGLTS